MLFKTAFALLILWLLGMFGVYRVGDLAHVFSARRTDAPVAGRAQGREAALRRPESRNND